MSFISFKNITKSFGKLLLYQDLSLEIEKGETMVIMGGSGTGKSVLIKLLLGLMPSDKGEIFFDGNEVGKMNSKELLEMRKRMGMLFQGAALFDSLTVAENIAYPLIEHFDYSPEEIKKIVKEKLEVVGLPGVEDKMPSDLSGGMKKRVGLARAIATDPEVILYDEPTTGLDPTNTNRIDELISQLQKDLKVTSIVVTHDMGSAFRVADRIALIYQKKIQFLGNKEDVKKSSNSIIQRFVNGELEE